MRDKSFFSLNQKVGHLRFFFFSFLPAKSFCLCSRCESLEDCVTDANVTLEHPWCCVTLAIESVLIRLCAGISKHGIATGDLTANLVTKPSICEVSFDISLTWLSKGTKQNFIFWISSLKRQRVLKYLNYSRANFYRHISSHRLCNATLFNSYVRFYQYDSTSSLLVNFQSLIFLEKQMVIVGLSVQNQFLASFFSRTNFQMDCLVLFFRKLSTKSDFNVFLKLIFKKSLLSLFQTYSVELVLYTINFSWLLNFLLFVLNALLFTFKITHVKFF